jgi:hypothetical protein
MTGANVQGKPLHLAVWRRRAAAVSSSSALYGCQNRWSRRMPGQVLGLLRAKRRRASFPACHLACDTTAADPTLPARDHRACRALLECYTMSVPVSGTEGYAEQAEELFEHYESLAALEMHRAILHLVPQIRAAFSTSAPVPGAMRPGSQIWATGSSLLSRPTRCAWGPCPCIDHHE